MLIETQLQKCHCNYAVQTVTIVRNRCFNKHTGKTSYQMLTDKKPNKFGSICYTYKQNKGKLDSRCDQGLFVGYKKNSPAYLVFYPDTGKVQRHRLMKFLNKVNVEKQAQTVEAESNDNNERLRQLSNEKSQEPRIRNKISTKWYI